LSAKEQGTFKATVTQYVMTEPMVVRLHYLVIRRWIGKSFKLKFSDFSAQVIHGLGGGRFTVFKD
jgi:hypothetical protein